MIDFEHTEEQRLMRDAVAQLAARIRTRTREIEHARALPDDLRAAALDMGLGGAVGAPASHGGAGLGLVTAVLLEEGLAHGDAAAGFALAGPGALALAVAELGTPAQAEAALAGLDTVDAFGAVAWGETKAHPERPGHITAATRDGDGWVLTGKKAFVLNAPSARRFVVFATTDAVAGWRGFDAFVVERDAPGVRVGARHTTLGLDAAAFGEVTFEAVRLPASARLAGASDVPAATVRFFAKLGLLVAARAVGLAQAAFDTTRDYVETRTAFGKPIGHFQAVAFTLADRAMDVDAARGLVQRAAAAWDQLAEGVGKERDALLASGFAISFALEAAMRGADDAVQLHGGAGFMRDYPVEKWMRDAKQLGLVGLTAEQADQLAAAVELGQPLDPALVLPTAETQSTFL